MNTTQKARNDHDWMLHKAKLSISAAVSLLNEAQAYLNFPVLQLTEKETISLVQELVVVKSINRKLQERLTPVHPISTLDDATGQGRR